MAHDNNDNLHHITPFNTYLKVAAALFVLTFMTIGFHSLRAHLGHFAPLIAFAIAAVKAALVMLWFMHLKYEDTMNRIIFASGFFFLLLLFGISILDIYSRITQTSVL